MVTWWRGSHLSARCRSVVPLDCHPSADPPRADKCSIHPGLAIPVADGRSAWQRLPQLVEPAQEDGLPRIPGEQPEDQPAARAHDLHRHEQKGVKKRFDSMRRTAPFSVAWRAVHRPVAGKRNANHALRVRASAAITMYAQLLSKVSTGIRVAPTPCFS